MTNPYTPPSTREDDPDSSPIADITLRRIGALGLASYCGKVMWQNLSDPDRSLLVVEIAGAAGVAAFYGFLIYGFLRRGRKFHLCIAIIFALSIASQAFSQWYLAPAREPGQWDPWLVFAIQIAPIAITFICATALYLRARRTPAPAA